MPTYRLRFWYWHQEIVITDITAEELIQSLFFPNSSEVDGFYREAKLDGNDGPYPIGISIHDLNHLTIEHLKEEGLEYIDTRFGEKDGRTELNENYWILEEES